MMSKSVRILAFIFLLVTSISACQQSEAPVTGSAAEAADVTPPANPTASDASDTPENVSTTKSILIFGDSITAGYGLSTEEAFPALIQEKLDARGWAFTVINGGLSGDTSAGGLRRIKWMLRTPVDVFVLELGGNDGLRGTPPEATRQNLQAIINEVKAANSETKIILAGMQIPPNLGQEYTEAFKDVFPDIAEANDAVLIPFLLDRVGGIPELNLPDGIHPTAEGHKLVAENVWEILEPLLMEMVSR
ncbi:MAG: arylesterase [Bacteroidota bacterium]